MVERGQASEKSEASHLSDLSERWSDEAKCFLAFLYMLWVSCEIISINHQGRVAEIGERRERRSSDL